MSKTVNLAASTIAPRQAVVSRDTAASVLLTLPMRLILFATAQTVLAFAFAIQQTPDPWDASIRYWPLTAAAANTVCLLLLHQLQLRRGQRLHDLFRIQPATFKRDILITLGLMMIGAPLALLPNVALAQWLFGDVTATGVWMLRPLPAWALIASAVLFPLTNALGELPTYFGFAMPRLEQLTRRRWAALLLPALFLAAQHVALPLTFDVRFILWRLGMFIPFALFVGFCLQKRPRLLPYLMVLHGLMDLQLILMIPPL